MFLNLKQKGVSSSSMPKSTSSLTLPVSSPSGQSQFEEVQQVQTFIPGQGHSYASEGHSSPLDIEHRLEDLTK